MRALAQQRPTRIAAELPFGRSPRTTRCCCSRGTLYRVELTPAAAETAVAQSSAFAAYEREDVAFRATAVEGTDLWSVGVFERDDHLPMPGAWFLVGPDARVWTFSSNPGIHHPALVVSAVARLYGAGAVDHVEPAPLAARLQSLTQLVEAEVRNLVSDAAGGDLRKRPPRVLP